MTLATVQLLEYRFAPGAAFEGQLLGALERLENGGALRVVDVLFVLRDAATGELAVIQRRGDGAGGEVAPLLGFRLDPHERRRATERAPEWARALGKDLEPGGALAAVLVEHRWAATLAEAADRTGGTLVGDRFVAAAALGELADSLFAWDAEPTRH